MKLNHVAIAAGIALLAVACNSVDFKKTKGGMPYKVIPGKGGKGIDSGNFVKLQIVQRIGDSLTFSSYNTGQPVYYPVTSSGNPYDFSEVLPSLKEGDSIYTIQLMDTFIARNPQMVPPAFKKGDTIKTGVRVVQVFTSQDAVQADQMKEQNMAFSRDTAIQTQLVKDEAALTAYLTANKIDAQKTGKGAYVQVLTPGTGAQATEGKYVSLMYKGSTFGGKVFDTNMDNSKGHTQPLDFKVGAPGMIPGFDEGVRTLHEGAKARIFIPSVLAYGPRPPSPDIEPNENLIFDVNVLKVSDAPMNQMQAPMPDSAARR